MKKYEIAHPVGRALTSNTPQLPHMIATIFCDALKGFETKGGLHHSHQWYFSGDTPTMRDVKVAQTLPGIAMQIQRRRLQERWASMTDDIVFDDEDKLTFLFQSDMLLSHQYLAAFRRRQLEPEKRLMLAVLEDAVACFQSYVCAQNRRKQTLFNEAEDWIRDENGDHVFSFENICAALKFNPKYVREGLLRWKMRKLAERPKIQLINIPSAGRKSVIRKRDTNRMIERVKQPYREKKIARLG